MASYCKVLSGLIFLNMAICLFLRCKLIILLMFHRHMQLSMLTNFEAISNMNAFKLVPNLDQV